MKPSGWVLAFLGCVCLVPTAWGQWLQNDDASAFQRQMAEALERDPQLPYVPGSLLVRFSSDLSAQERALLRFTVGGAVVRSFDDLVPGLEQLAVGLEPTLAVIVLSGLPGVEYAEPDLVVRACGIPNDPSFGLLWGLHNTGQTVNGDPGTSDADIDAPEAWDTYTGNPNLAIAIIDTGIQLNHPDLQANLWTNPGETAGNGIDDDGNGYVDDVYGWDFYYGDNNPNDGNGHGTHTAGTVGAVGNNGIGVAGVNWRCKLVALKFLSDSGSGSLSGAIAAVQYCTRMGLRISNNSWGGGGYSQSLYDAIASSRSIGHLFVAAAGNSGSNNDSTPFYPASYNLDNIIAVAATDNDDRRASFSNYGRTSVDLGAPGVNVYSTYAGSSYRYLDGTSMAAPHVAGVVGLVYGRNSGWTYAQVRDRIFSTVRRVSSLANITVTGGVVNAAAAIGGTTNTRPTVTISSPQNNAQFRVGQSIQFTGSASDAEDGNLTAALVWTSSISGQIGTGGSFTRNDLPAGTHTITASATDSGGLTGSASVVITISHAGGPPAAPSNLTATNLGGGRCRLNWTDNSNNETGFTIERQRRTLWWWTNTTTITVGANTTTYTDNPGSGTYRYRIRAYNGDGASAWTPYVQVTVTN